MRREILDHDRAHGTPVVHELPGLVLEQEFDLRMSEGPLLGDAIGLELRELMHDRDSGGEARDEQRLFDCRVAPPDHHHVLAVVVLGVTGGTVGDSLALELAFALDADGTRGRAGGDQELLADDSLQTVDDQASLPQIHVGNVGCQSQLYSGGLRVLYHQVREHIARLGLGKPWKVRDLVRDGKVASAEPGVHRDDAKLGLCSVDPRCQTRRATAENEQVRLGRGPRLPRSNGARGCGVDHALECRSHRRASDRARKTRSDLASSVHE